MPGIQQKNATQGAGQFGGRSKGGKKGGMQQQPATQGASQFGKGSGKGGAVKGKK